MRLNDFIIEDTQYHNLYEHSVRAGKYLAEANLTPAQINDIFSNVEQQAMAGGNNKTVAGKVGGAVAGAAGAVGSAVGKATGAINQAYQNLLDKVSSTAPVQAFDSKMDQLMGQLKTATGGDQGVNKYVQKYRAFAQKHPVAQGILYSALVAAAGLATGGAGAPAAVGLLKATDRLLQGDKFSQAIMKGATTAGASLILQDIKRAFGASGQMPDQQAQDLAAATDQRDLNPAGQAAATDQRDLNPRADAKPATDASIAADNPGTPAPPVSNTHDYVVKRGDTLSQIAQRNHVSVKDMMDANPGIRNPNALAVGQDLKIPDATGNKIYAGGVGTAADTARGVASGQYQPMNQALKTASQAVAKKKLGADIWSAGYKFSGLPISEMIDQAATENLTLLHETFEMEKAGVILSAAGIGMVFHNLAGLHNHLIEASNGPGIFSRIASGIKGGVSDLAKNLGNKITADKLAKAWRSAGSPTDSDEIRRMLYVNGVDRNIVSKVYQELNIPISNDTARGGAPAPGSTTQPTASAANAPAAGSTPTTAANAPAAPADKPVRGGVRNSKQAADQALALVKQVRKRDRAKVKNYIKQELDKIPESVAESIEQARGLLKLASFAPADRKQKLIAEAANAAQQAAIAISMKKAGKKPKKDEAVQPGQFVEPSDAAKQQIKTNNQQSADKAAIGRAQMGIMSMDEAEKKGLYYYVNQRKKKGISRSKDNPKAPTDQAWKDAAKTAKK